MGRMALGAGDQDGTSFLGAKAAVLAAKNTASWSHVDGFDVHYPHNPHGDHRMSQPLPGRLDISLLL